MNKRDKLLEWITRAEFVGELQIIGSGMERQLNELRREGLVKMVEHPHVRDARAATLASKP